jgi:hypothetical protein
MTDQKAEGRTADAGGSLEDFVAVAFGDYADDAPESSNEPEASAESPASETSAEGLTPDAAGSTEPENPNAATETPDAEHAGLTPAVAAAAESEDPLAGATPLSYVADGESKTYTGVTLLKSGGAIVEPAHVQRLQQDLGKADHYFRESQGLNAQLQQLNGLLKWDYRDTQGTQRSLTGLDALELRESAREMAVAELSVLRSILQDPEKLVGLLTVTQDQNGNYAGLALNKPAVDGLWQSAKNASEAAKLAVRSQFVTLPRAQQVEAQAPQVTPQALGATVDLAAQQLGVTLSPESRTFLTAQAARYVRDSTPEERATLGPKAIDATFLDLVKREGSRTTDAARIAKVASEAAKKNVANLAAARVGQRQPGKPTVPSKPTSEQDDPQATAWAARERALARAI